MALPLICVVLGLVGATGPEKPGTEPAQLVAREIAALSRKVRKFKVVPLGGGGTQILTTSQSVTVEDLRDINLDSNPPKLRKLEEPYSETEQDGIAADQAAPYVASGILPFRFKYFNCEFNYGGWHTLQMQEYAACHGFNIIYPYVRKLSQRSRMPSGTQWLNWGGVINWETWMPQHGIPAGRYDLLNAMDVQGTLLKEGILSDHRPSESQYNMIDMEHPVLMPEALRTQSWYPQNGSIGQQADFESKYYSGYVQTYVATLRAAKKLGFKNVSTYGWEPFPRTWWGLDKFQLDVNNFEPWKLFGRRIHDSCAVDILNPSLYVFYWSPQNVASTVCNLDFNRQLTTSCRNPLPIRPYYWTQLHGGDANPHWWKEQPVPNEEATAWTFFGLMSGIDGFDLWNWSGVGNHNAPNPLTSLVNGKVVGNDFCVKNEFNAKTTVSPGRMMKFHRYDFIHVTTVDAASNTVRFQRLDVTNADGKYGLTESQPEYQLPTRDLVANLRANAEPVAGVVEGMALAKVFEEFLHFGKLQSDESSLKEFLEATPIFRRIRLGKYDLIATYDPKVVYGSPARNIVLKDLAGQKGRVLQVPADGQLRVWVLARN
jgi:hypothetical protein